MKFNINRFAKLAGMRLLKEQLDPDYEWQIDHYIDELQLRVSPDKVAKQILDYQIYNDLDISEIITYISKSNLAGVDSVIEILSDNMSEEENLSSEEEEKIARYRNRINP